jgi:hypothetical protein
LVKKELQEKVETAKGEIQKGVELLKAKLTKDVEAVKTSLAAESIAFGELTKAMYAFYYAVSKLEEDAYVPSLAETRDDEIGAAAYHLSRIDESCEAHYRLFWHELHAVRQTCEVAQSDTEKIAYWLRRKSAILQHQKKFEDCFSKHHLTQNADDTA